jgi:mannitol/fructose-specific phosphotransferase system IIA component (Ntr-type)/predicted transcriptional regulator
MRLANLLDEDLIICNLQVTSKQEAIKELLELIGEKYPDHDYDAILASIIEREEIENTSYGRGIAFPHARTDAVDEMYIAVGISPKGLEDKTPDNQPLQMVCLMLTPSNIAKLYLQALSAFASFARQQGSLDRVVVAKSPGAVIDAIWESNVTVEKELTAKDLMRRDVVAVMPEDSLKRVANLMFRHRLSALAVVDDQGNLIGQITDKELIQAALPDFKTLISNLNYSMDVESFEELLKKEDKIKVKQLYKTDHEMVARDAKIVEVAAMMLFKDLRRVFVTENDKLVGILLRKDIVHMIIRG